jgi:hypothetical protein
MYPTANTFNLLLEKGAAERAWSRSERSTSALNFAFPESIVIFPGFDNISWEYPFRLWVRLWAA